MSTTATKSKKKKQKRKQSISRRVRDAVASVLANSDTCESDFSVWQEHLDDRQLDGPLHLIEDQDSHPIYWGTAGLDVPAANRKKNNRLVKRSSSEPNAEAIDWLARVASRSDVESSLEHLSWATILSDNARVMRPQTWAACLHHLLQAATSGLNAAEANLESWLVHGPLESIVVGPELAIWLAYLFPEIPACNDLAVPAFEAMSAAIGELLDGEGLPEACHLPIFRALAASWIRAQSIGRAKGKKSWRLNKSARRDFDWMVRQLLRCTGPKLMPVFGPADPTFDSMIRAAVQLTGDEEDQALVDLIVRQKRVSDERLPEEPSYHSEWAEAAILRPDWSPKGPQLAITYDNEQLQVELSNLEQRLLSGPWSSVVRVDGQQLHQTSEWDTTCWFSDFDVDFLELEADYENGWSIQRQFLLARQDLFLWTAEILTGSESAQIEIESSVPLDAAVRCHQNDQFRDFSIVGRRKLAHALPVGLSEWQIERGGGELTLEDGAISLFQRQQGTGLCVPWFFDLHPDRIKQNITWRQLTVVEDLEIVGGDTAVGYRVQAGREQWLWYRALRMPGCRTVLGQNYSSEFVCTRFLKDGDTDDLVSID